MWPSPAGWLTFIAALLELVSASSEHVPAHVRFPAAPVCPFKSNSRDRFFDVNRKLCVLLEEDEVIPPLSAPCPPGSARRQDDFLCRGEITTAWEIKCRHAGTIFPTRPFHANQDYQCVQAIVYNVRPDRCPHGFTLQKVIDRYGTHAGRLGTICVSKMVKPAEVIEIDPISLESCKFVVPRQLLRGEESIDEIEIEVINEDLNGIPSFIENYSVKRKSGGHQCARVSTNRMIRCQQEGELVQSGNGTWDCVSLIRVSPETDPAACKKRYWFSHEFNMCVYLEAYVPPRTCPTGFDSKPVVRSGITRRQRRAPRYYGDETDPDRCLIDSALPDNPYCPKGYWLELYRYPGIPKCIKEITSEPTWTCNSVEGSALVNDGPSNDWACEVHWSENAFVPGPDFLSKRERENAKSLLKKQAATPFDLQEAFAAFETFQLGTSWERSSDLAWRESVDAALRLLNPETATEDLTVQLWQQALDAEAKLSTSSP